MRLLRGGARPQGAERLRLWSGERGAGSGAGGRPWQIEENPPVTARVCLAGWGERCFSLSHQIGLHGLRACVKEVDCRNPQGVKRQRDIKTEPTV